MTYEKFYRITLVFEAIATYFMSIIILQGPVAPYSLLATIRTHVYIAVFISITKGIAGNCLRWKISMIAHQLCT